MFFEKRGARLECIHPPITNNIHFPSKRKKAEDVKKLVSRIFLAKINASTLISQ